MKNIDQEIFRILTLAGQNGLKVDRIARHVFNSCNSMFTPLNYKEVHVYVSQFLIKYSKKKNSLIEKGEGHGVYRLNYHSKEAEQIMIKFTDASQDNNQDIKREDSDNSLSLF